MSETGTVVARPKELARAQERVERWVSANRSKTLDPRSLGSEAPDVDALALALAINELVKSGRLRRIYKVLMPNGETAEAEFDNPGSIPDKLPDTNHNFFDTASADIIPVFRAR